jgi:hypothetical protein
MTITLATDGTDSNADGINDAFDVTLVNALNDGSIHTMAWYADVTGDGMCTFSGPMGDRAWTLVPVGGGPATGDVAVVEDFDLMAADPTGCALF